MSSKSTSANLTKRALLWLLPLGFMALFYFYPLSQILSTGLGRAVGSAVFARVLSSPGTLGVLWFTLWQAAVSTLLTLLLGLPGAYLLARRSFPGKGLFRAVTGIPFVMPTLVVAAGFSALLGPQGWVNALAMDWLGLENPPIRFINTIWAILSAHVFYNLTIVLRLVGDYWERLDPRLEAAARSLGANGWQVLQRLTLPLLSPAIISAALLVFIFNFSSFAVVLLLGGPRFATLEVEIYYQTSALFDLPAAAVLSILQLASTLALTVMYTRLANRVARPTRRRAARRSGRLSRLQGAYLIGVLAFSGLPLLALAARSFTHLGPARTPDGTLPTGFTLAFYRALFDSQPGDVLTIPALQSIGVSLGNALATVGLALLVGLPAAWLLSRRSGDVFSRLIDPVLMLPLGTSAVTMGLGFIIALNRPPLDLRTSPLLVPLAHTLVAFPFVVRVLVPALQSIRPRLRQAAAVLGAPPGEVIRRVDLPLVGRALLVAAIFAFMISLGEFGATALIARPSFQTVPSAIFRLLGRPGALNYGQGLALSTVLMVITAGGMLAIERWRIGEGEVF
jgi:thiamine transport system permease protein